jgi:hypothetical protein
MWLFGGFFRYLADSHDTGWLLTGRRSIGELWAG